MNRRNHIKSREIVYARTYIGSISKKIPWCKPGFITLITGFDGEKLRQLRDQGLIEFQKREDGFWYNLDSVPERLLIKK